MYHLPCLGARPVWLTGLKENFSIPNVSKILDWRYFYSNKPSVSTVFSVKEDHSKEQTGRNVLIWKIWRFLSMGKKGFYDGDRKNREQFCEDFCFMKVFICFALVPSPSKYFSAPFLHSQFSFKSHISPLQSSTLWLWNPHLVTFSCCVLWSDQFMLWPQQKRNPNPSCTA